MKQGATLNLPKGWEIKRLDDACEVEYGTRVVQKRDGGKVYPVYGGGGATFFMDSFNREDCLVVARFAMSAQCTRFIEGKFFLNDSGLTVRPKNDKELLPDFLNLQMLFLNDHIYSLSRGTAQRNLDVPAFRNIQISYPKSLPEQQRIVSILDQAFAAIDKAKAHAEQNLKNAKELFEGYLQEVFENGNWETKTLNQISENLDSKRIPITKNQRKSGDIPYYGASGIVDYVADCIFDEDLLCVSEDGANLLARTYPIAFSISGKTWVNNHAHVLRFPNIITQKFVEVYINSIKIDDYVSGMAQPKLNQAMLNKIPIPFPSLEEQQTIVRQLDALRAETQKLEAAYQQKIADLEELKKSILQKAFAGELKTEKAVAV
jgi:type I restriction enzyme S subunit